ncbi:hypothetical protein BDN71DRAFT_1383360 [Pleurotus eryngii]|uniref:Defect at low temperature protein 1 n=1 Tax=Pleurotus eryngii TaxID=5323 RepID=A0A9P6A6C5_PLEER|nr:hypothetical protein BDN71DRAFT_1383360 [Pleurotus eryngii]
MISPAVKKTLSGLGYIFLVLVTICATSLSSVALLTQAVRASPRRSWTNNFDAVVIGASYVIVLVASLLLCIKRRVAVRMRLQRISKVYRIIGRNDVPKSVHRYIEQEYARTCLVAYESLPKDAFHEGWGRPGTKYEGIRFRRALLDTIPQIDELARAVIPSHPAMKPHARMLHHFRFILPLLPSITSEEENISFLNYYDSAIQIVRNSSREPTEAEFELGMQAAQEIINCLTECQLDLMESSQTQLDGDSSVELT